MASKWTPEEIAYLTEHYKTTTAKELAAALGRSEGAVTSFNETYLHLGKQYAYTADEDAYLIAHIGTMTHAALGKKLGRSTSSVRNRCTRLKIHRPRVAPPLSTDQRQYIADNADTMTRAQIAAVLGCPTSKIDNYCSQHNIITLSPTAQLHNAIMAAYNSDKTTPRCEIAKLVGCSAGSVTQHLRASGVRSGDGRKEQGSIKYNNYHKRILEAYRPGEASPVARISRELNIAKSTVLRHLQSAGIAIPHMLRSTDTVNAADRKRSIVLAAELEAKIAALPHAERPDRSAIPHVAQPRDVGTALLDGDYGLDPVDAIMIAVSNLRSEQYIDVRARMALYSARLARACETGMPIINNYSR